MSTLKRLFDDTATADIRPLENLTTKALAGAIAFWWVYTMKCRALAKRGPSVDEGAGPGAVAVQQRGAGVGDNT